MVTFLYLGTNSQLSYIHNAHTSQLIQFERTFLHAIKFNPRQAIDKIIFLEFQKSYLKSVYSIVVKMVLLQT